MPRVELMTWVPAQKTWTKRFRGRRFYVSCRQLGVSPPNKEASLAAANEWWRNKQAELDLAEKANQQQATRTPPPGEDIIAAMLNSGPWTERESIARSLSAYLETLPPSPAAEALAESLNHAAYAESEQGDADAWEHLATELGKRLLPALLAQTILQGQPIPSGLKEHLPPARAAQLGRGINAIRGEEATPVDRTIDAAVAAWLSYLRVQVSIKGMTAARYHVLEQRIAYFSSFVGGAADVASIDAESLQSFFNFCASKMAERNEDKKAGWSSEYARGVFAAAKQWLQWLKEQGKIELPSNFQRRWSFGPPAKSVPTYTVEECRQFVGAASGKLRLCMLLALNCGFSQKDASDLKDSEVDWREGRIIRKRSKTHTIVGVPIVDYKLWDSTFALLKKYRSGQERVLLSESGAPFVNKRFVNGRFVEYDGFRYAANRLKKKLGVNISLKLFRKSAASLLENHVVTLPSGEKVNPFAGCVGLFLGHSPRSVADRHYVSPPQALLDAAVTWLGERLGVESLDANDR